MDETRKLETTFGATLTLRPGRQHVPGPDGYEEPSITIEHPGLLDDPYPLGLSAEEAIALAHWLIRQAPEMQSQVGSGRLVRPGEAVETPF